MRHHRKKSRRTGRDVAPPAGEELDSLFGETTRSNDKRTHKDLQLCRQAYRTLSVALAGGCGDDVLAGFAVRAVVPAPDASRLLVCLEPAAAGADGGNASFDVADVLARLERVRPALRREVAGALARKRAPELEFVVVPRATGEGVRP